MRVRECSRSPGLMRSGEYPTKKSRRHCIPECLSMTGMQISSVAQGSTVDSKTTAAIVGSSMFVFCRDGRDDLPALEKIFDAEPSQLLQHLLRFVPYFGRLVDLGERLEFGLCARLVAALQQCLGEMEPDIVLAGRDGHGGLQQVEAPCGVAVLDEDPPERVEDGGVGRREHVDPLRVFACLG